MAKGKITKPDANAVVYPVNHRMTWDGVTIQNITNGNIVIKITGDNVQSVAPGSVTWSNPTTGSTYPTTAITLPAGEVFFLSIPCTAMQFSGAGVGVINVVEAY